MTPYNKSPVRYLHDMAPLSAKKVIGIRLLGRRDIIGSSVEIDPRKAYLILQLHQLGILQVHCPIFRYMVFLLAL